MFKDQKNWKSGDFD